MSVTTLLSKIEAFAARTPTDPQDIDEMLDLILDITRRQFDAYLVDIMWETGQGHRTELRAVRMYETESHGYGSRPIYRQKEPGKPDSLMGWCYENDQPVWVVDPEGLKRAREYENRWLTSFPAIPQDTIYEYNVKAKICTEICCPLRTYVDKEVRRAAGVLNIEIREAIYPSPLGKRFVSGVASVTEQLQNRRLASQTASDYARAAIRELSQLKATTIDDEPGFSPNAFVALPMSVPGAHNLMKWIEKTLAARGIRCSWPETNGDITDAIWQKIRRAHFGVVVSTGFNRNVLLEWGFLLGCRKPLLRLHSPSGDGETDPFDVAGVRSWPLNRRGEDFTQISVQETLDKAIDQLIRENSELAALLSWNAVGPGKVE